MCERKYQNTDGKHRICESGQKTAIIVSRKGVPTIIVTEAQEPRPHNFKGVKYPKRNYKLSKWAAHKAELIRVAKEIAKEHPKGRVKIAVMPQIAPQVLPEKMIEDIERKSKEVLKKIARSFGYISTADAIEAGKPFHSVDLRFEE